MGGVFYTPYTFTILSVLLKAQRNTHFQSAFGHKKTETPIFQEISHVLTERYCVSILLSPQCYSITECYIEQATISCCQFDILEFVDYIGVPTSIKLPSKS